MNILRMRDDDLVPRFIEALEETGQRAVAIYLSKYLRSFTVCLVSLLANKFSVLYLLKVENNFHN